MDRNAIFLCSATILLCLYLQPSHQQQPPVRPHQKQDQRHNPHLNQQHQHHHHHHHHKHFEEPPAKQVDPLQNVRIIVPDLPPSHYQFWLRNHPRAFQYFKEICEKAPYPSKNITEIAQFHELHQKLYFENSLYMKDLKYGTKTLDQICSKISLVGKSCWGYEINCHEIYLMPECLGTSRGEAKNEEEHKIKWFTQADFGYIMERRNEVHKFCAPDKQAKLPDASSLECSKHFATCRGENLFLHSHSDSFIARPRIKVVGGRNCDLQASRIKQEDGRRGSLESWYSELKNYKLLNSTPECDLTIEERVFFVKINSTLSFEDNLGSYINLYATIHLNNLFSHDSQIVIWEKNLPSDGRSLQLLQAFSRQPVIGVGSWTGKRVCVKKFVFAMPPKMPDGLHNRPNLIEGCSKSGLYNAFSKHVVHRLKVPNMYDRIYHAKTRNNLIRIALLIRPEDKFRTILNEKELVQRLSNHSRMFHIQRIPYDLIDLPKLMILILNSDILIGMHGTGLSYSLFAPDWASLIELHNCGKQKYQNLARLRGLGYFTRNDLAERVPVGPESKHYGRLNESGLLEEEEYSNYNINIEAVLKLIDEVRVKTAKNRANYFKADESTVVADEPVIKTGARPSTSTSKMTLPTTQTNTAASNGTSTSTTTSTSSPTSTLRRQIEDSPKDSKDEADADVEEEEEATNLNGTEKEEEAEEEVEVSRDEL